jgi:hypothetical protein
MTSLPLMTLIIVLGEMPCEYSLDFGPKALPFKNRKVITLTAKDGSALRIPGVSGRDADPVGVRDHILFVLKDNDWVARPGPGATLIVTGTTKGSAVKLVTVISDAGVPTVRWVPIAPKSPKPKK